MPVTIQPANEKQEQIENSLAKILKDISADHDVLQTVNEWRQQPDSMSLWWAIFNERKVGFVLVDSKEIKALAVHPATRSRGVGQRMLDLIQIQYPTLKLATGCQVPSALTS